MHTNAAHLNFIIARSHRMQSHEIASRASCRAYIFANPHSQQIKVMITRLNRMDFSKELHLSGNAPVIITDGLSGWSERGQWSPALLCSKVKDQRVRVSISQDNRFNWKPSRVREQLTEFSYEEMNFTRAAELIADSHDERQIYVMQQSLQEKFPELLEHIAVPEWIADQAQIKTNLWFGGHSHTQLHYDGQNNFFAQLHGTKEFTVFAPEDTQYLYPFPLDSLFPHGSHVDPDQPDAERQPKYAYAKPMRFTVQAGELLFLPAFWWHRVKAHSVSISINFWWPASLSQYVSAPNSFRNLYQSYASDRLRTLKRTSLAPRGLDFSSASFWLLKAGANWGAGILALADLDQVVDKLCGTAGVVRPQGCALRELPGELSELLPKLAAFGVTESFQTASQLALQIEHGTDFDVSASHVQLVLTLTQSLNEPAS
jgi:jumonji domain-containing protein 7